MIFQDPLTSLNPVYTIGTRSPRRSRRTTTSRKRVALDRAIELLDIVGIPHPKQRMHNYPHEMSGGMRQRVVIAIAMANNPDVIIADEPTTALDVTVQAQVLEALEAARKETGAALVLITHDLGVIAGHADRVCVMYAGKLVETGTVDDDLLHPAHAVLAGPARQPAAHRRVRPRAAHADHRGAAVAAEPAARLPVHATLPAGAGHLRGGRARAHGDDQLWPPRRMPFPRRTRRGHSARTSFAAIERRSGGTAVTEQAASHPRPAPRSMQSDRTGGPVRAQPGQALPGALPRDRPAPQIGDVHAVCDISFDIFAARDARPGRGVRLRQDHDGPAAAQPRAGDRGIGLLPGQGHRAAVAAPGCGRCASEMQIVFQDPFASLDPRMTVIEIIAEPLRIHGLYGSSAEGKARCAT